MSIQEVYADECRICGCYSNRGFDICEECCRKDERKLAKKEFIELIDICVKREQRDLKDRLFPMGKNNVEIVLNNLGVELKKELGK